jgi:hypothetical protein
MKGNTFALAMLASDEAITAGIARVAEFIRKNS